MEYYYYLLPLDIYFIPSIMWSTMFLNSLYIPLGMNFFMV